MTYFFGIIYLFQQYCTRAYAFARESETQVFYINFND